MFAHLSVSPVFISSPTNLDAGRGRLDFEREEELLFSALDGPWNRGEIEIDVAEDGCFETLLNRLENNTYHAVILSMHGTPARNEAGKEEWGLLFEEQETGLSAPLAGSDFTAQLAKLTPGQWPKLIVLAACRSAKVEESAEPIASVAKQLHESGFERVLGMRLSVLDSAASAFNADLFQRLARGEEVGRAVTLAREEVAQGKWLNSSDSAHKDVALERRPV